MGRVDCGDFKLAVNEAAASAGAETTSVFEARPGIIRNDRRVVERDDAHFLQSNGNAQTNAIMISTWLGRIGIRTDFRRIANGNVKHIRIRSPAARRSGRISGARGIGSLQFAVKHGDRIRAARIATRRARTAIAITTTTTIAAARYGRRIRARATRTTTFDDRGTTSCECKA